MNTELKYNSFQDKELGYFLRRQPSIQRLMISINLAKFKSQKQIEGSYFPVVVKIKKGKRNPRATIRGRKNRNRVKRGLNISLMDIARNRCHKKYGFSGSVVSKGYLVYEDGSHRWYEFPVANKSSFQLDTINVNKIKTN